MVCPLIAGHRVRLDGMLNAVISRTVRVRVLTVRGFWEAVAIPNVSRGMQCGLPPNVEVAARCLRTYLFARVQVLDNAMVTGVITATFTR